jgi:hypothetical protein
MQAMFVLPFIYLISEGASPSHGGKSGLSDVRERKVASD